MGGNRWDWVGVDGGRWKRVGVGRSESQWVGVNVNGSEWIEWLGACFSKTHNKICLDIFRKNKINQIITSL